METEAKIRGIKALGYEQTTFDEWNKLKTTDTAGWIILEGGLRVGDNDLYFKPKEVWPKTFSDGNYDAEVTMTGEISIFNGEYRMVFMVDSSLDVLSKAVKVSDKVRDIL